jgi:hypothetical protein
MSSQSQCPGEEQVNIDSDPEYTSSETDDEIQFYDRRKRPPQKVCPFAEPHRSNPCPNYDKPRTCKDSIMKHLHKVHDAGGDAHHPLNDPLWDSFAVKYFLSPRPPKLNPKKRMSAKQASQSRYYKKRKRIQSENLDSMEELFREGKIGEDEFKKILVGEKRRLFITTRRLQMDFDVRIEREVEMRVREEVETKLSELTARLQTDQDPVASAADIASLQALQAAQKELDITRETLSEYQEMLLYKSEDVVQFYASKEFLPSNTNFLEFHGFRWPGQSSSESFYGFATMLVPISSWIDCSALRTGSSIRYMALRLSEHIKLEKENVEEEEHVHLEGIHATFNACCDIVTGEEKKTASMSVAGREVWLGEQERMWESAKVQFHSLFKFNSHAPIQQIKVIDDFADIWRMRNAAELNSQTAVEKAREVAQHA